MTITCVLKLWDGSTIVTDFSDSREVEDEEEAFAIVDELTDAFVKAGRKT